MTPEIADKIRASFAKQGLMQTFGAQMINVASDAMTITAPITAATSQQAGFAHAGLTFALADSAGGYAALSIMPEEAEVVTSEFKIHLLAPAKGDRLEAVGRVIKPGRRLVIVESNVYATNGKTRTHVAMGTGTMVPVVKTES